VAIVSAFLVLTRKVNITPPIFAVIFLGSLCLCPGQQNFHDFRNKKGQHSRPYRQGHHRPGERIEVE
jgi:hypothetical protein